MGDRVNNALGLPYKSCYWEKGSKEPSSPLSNASAASLDTPSLLLFFSLSAPALSTPLVSEAPRAKVRPKSNGWDSNFFHRDLHRCELNGNAPLSSRLNGAVSFRRPGKGGGRPAKLKGGGPLHAAHGQRGVHLHGGPVDQTTLELERGLRLPRLSSHFADAKPATAFGAFGAFGAAGSHENVHDIKVVSLTGGNFKVRDGDEAIPLSFEACFIGADSRFRRW
eukprot:CAMPEP_0171842516 /NCGR_PEP_ID=MMETSP0992-20121227/15252_1 /TAXON_ID=483369 /ORGANISM="non described non described, Strain CCMP2098" /LENGTH=222 /DNA_ID=CAMNT_0012459799 /DNA_START=248 /DNA_END=912 /DNA_ORIENTATION=+